jgi:hypothetical protein
VLGGCLSTRIFAHGTYHPTSQVILICLSDDYASSCPSSSSGQGGTLANPQPGTVVDSDIVHPTWYNFFLVSQSVKQGIVTPSHYHVIQDRKEPMAYPRLWTLWHWSTILARLGLYLNWHTQE